MFDTYITKEFDLGKELKKVGNTLLNYDRLKMELEKKDGEINFLIQKIEYFKKENRQLRQDLGNMRKPTITIINPERMK